MENDRNKNINMETYEASSGLILEQGNCHLILSAKIIHIATSADQGMHSVPWGLESREEVKSTCLLGSEHVPLTSSFSREVGHVFSSSS